MSRRRKRRFTIRFEVGLGGLLGLSIICLCVFLWLFLLGVWAGQTVLLPSGEGNSTEVLQRLASDLWQRGRQANERLAPPAAGKPAALQKQGKKTVPAQELMEEEEPSFFTLQVATYDEAADAEEEVLSWQAKGQDSFFLDPMEGADHYRVFIGRYDTLAEANEVVNDLEENEHIQAFITLLPAHNIGR